MNALTQTAVRTDVRNIAIIAHVDHGKTTLVDKMLRQAGVFRTGEAVAERVMDTNDLERERGITILSKATSVHWGRHRFNIVDTPGHADFSGEVERVLTMVDGVLLLVDACEGPMPQTKFVLRKSLDLGLRPIVVVNKIDRPGARPHEVVDQVFDLFVELNAAEAQLDFPVVFVSAKEGYARLDPAGPEVDLGPLFDLIIEHVPAPAGDPTLPFQMQVTSIEYDNYIGRMALGRVMNGRIAPGETAARVMVDGAAVKAKVTHLFVYEGLRRTPFAEARAGDIVLLAGFDEVEIGETLTDPERPAPLPPLSIGEPTLSIYFIVNNSPFAGREGKYVSSRNLRERLMRELRSNVALRVEETDLPEVFKVSGRGELHLAILIETMRREGHELAVSRPEVILREIDGEVNEPFETVLIDVPEEYVGVVMETLGPRRAEMQDMTSLGDGTVRLEFLVPSRGLFGYRNAFLTDTRGTGILNHTFHSYRPFAGEIPGRLRGSLISMETGTAVAYALWNLQERGVLFVEPGEPIYEGMVVGEHARTNDLRVNPCKTKHLTNIRAAGSDEAIRLTPPREKTLERAIEFIADDELVEVTPKSIRLRKRDLTGQDAKRKKG
ncbi:MAG: translational GTPase TypA [Nitrospirae bacterium]|nr:translational GTPase TypA [Nitrospirota bacterium]